MSAFKPLVPIMSLLVLLAATLLGLAWGPGVGAQDPPPQRSGLIERTGVRLMLLDVTVTDKRGNPVPGLTKSDFTVRLNGKPWPISSVDDLCDCLEREIADAAERAEVDDVGSSSDTTGDAPSATHEAGTRSPIEDPLRFVLYFDFSQLRADGRAFAVEQAQRWVAETMQSTDETMVVAYTSQRGTRTLSPFTRDKQALLEVIDAAYSDPTLVDDFPMARPMRIEACVEACTGKLPMPCKAACLYYGARVEHRHGRHSMEALKTLLTTLEPIPGRKALLMFHQNGTLFPARYYWVDERLVGDHLTLADEIGAEANLARTAIYTAFAGEYDGYAVNLGANLADFTGGGYNRGPTDLGRLTERAGRACACLYRIGLEPPENDGSDIYKVKIDVRGGVVPYRYRVTYIDEGERWMRDAWHVLRNPAAATNLPVVATILPVVGQDKGWDVRVQVALSPRSLALLPQGLKKKGNWEVGALLTNDRGNKSWEMLVASELFRETEGETTTVLVHERVFRGLRPGRYRLRAFVRDRVADLYGRAATEVELPRPGRDSLVGPLLMRSEARLLTTGLPLRSKKEPGREVTTQTVQEGSLALSGRPVVQSEPIEFLNWICGGKNKGRIERLQRYVSLDGEPIFRFESSELQGAGECVRIIDRLDTTPMEPGSYTYHVRWNQGPNLEPLLSETVFEVVTEIEL